MYKVRYKFHWLGSSFHVFNRHDLFFYKYFTSFKTHEAANEHIARWRKIKKIS